MIEAAERDEKTCDIDAVHPFAIESMSPSQIEAYREQFGQDPFPQAQYDELKEKEEIRRRRVSAALELATGNIPFIQHSKRWMEDKVNEKISSCGDEGTASFVIGAADETNNILVTAVDPVTATSHALYPLDNLSNDEDAIEFINDKLYRFMMPLTEVHAFLDRVNASASMFAGNLSIGIVWAFYLDYPKRDGASRRQGYQRIVYKLRGSTSVESCNGRADGYAISITTNNKESEQ